MSIEVASTYTNPITTHGGQEVQDAFLRKYNIDFKQVSRLAAGHLGIKKIG